MSDETNGEAGGGTNGPELERRYRGLLRILPKRYREARGEELLSALMDGAAEDRRWPEIREALSLARLGLRVRMGDTAADGALVDTRVGATARAVAISGTILLAIVSVMQLAVIMNTIRGNPAVHFEWAHPFTITFLNHQDYSIAYCEVPACWLVVLALVGAGRWQAAKALATVVFVLSVGLTSGTRAALEEETLLAAVVTAALLAVRGVHAGPARAAGAAGMAVALGMGALVFGELGVLGHYAKPVERFFMALQAVPWGEQGILVGAMAVAAVGCAVGYRSVVWSVACAVVTVATAGPVMAWLAVDSGLGGTDLGLMLGLSCVLMVVAGLAVARERRSARREQPTAVS